MSQLDELVEDYKEYFLESNNDLFYSGWKTGYNSAMQDVSRMLPSHNAEICKQALRDQMELTQNNKKNSNIFVRILYALTHPTKSGAI